MKMSMKKKNLLAWVALLIFTLSCSCSGNHFHADTHFSDEQIENLVRKTYRYVSTYIYMNDLVNGTGISTRGWNKLYKPKKIRDEREKIWQYPNDDALYLVASLDLRNHPVVISLPALSADYASMRIFSFDSSIQVPLSTRYSNFNKDETILFYSQRTKEMPQDDMPFIDHFVKLSGDFAIAVLTVVPNLKQKNALQQSAKAVRKTELFLLPEYLEITYREDKLPKFIKVKSFNEAIEKHYLQILQFTFNFLSFNENLALDQEALQIAGEFGVAPGQNPYSSKIPRIKSSQIKKALEKIKTQQFIKFNAISPQDMGNLYLPKEQMTADLMLMQAICAPLNPPAQEYLNIKIKTKDAQPMDGRFEYALSMHTSALPPAQGPWSFMSYHGESGKLVFSYDKKYSVGTNTGMQLDTQGNLNIYLSEKKPTFIPEENYLPLKSEDRDVELLLRIYAPDLRAFKNWQPPEIKKIIKNPHY